MVLNDIVPWAILLGFFWLVALTIWLYKTTGHYSRLVQRTDKRRLEEILEKLLSDQDEVARHVGRVEEQLGELKKESLGHVQKLGIVRFNPFPETGGNQSFALSCLDGEDSGFVLLSLHGREATRIYVKPVVRGKSRLELSREENQAIAQAQKHA